MRTIVCSFADGSGTSIVSGKGAKDCKSLKSRKRVKEDLQQGKEP